VTFVYLPSTAVQVSSIARDFRGANNYRPNVTGDPYGERAITNYFNRDNVVPISVRPTTATAVRRHSAPSHRRLIRASYS
jgi:hypothetical protein